MEEEYIQQMCEDLMRVKPDLVITEKGISGEDPRDPVLCLIRIREVRAVLNAPFSDLTHKQPPLPQSDFERDFGSVFSFSASSSTVQPSKLVPEAVVWVPTVTFCSSSIWKQYYGIS